MLLLQRANSIIRYPNPSSMDLYYLQQHYSILFFDNILHNK
jgi:hypothetical protein